MRTVIASIAIVTTTSVGSAQQSPQPPVGSQTFDVVSIKPNTSGASMVTGGYAPGGRYVLVNGPAASLIRAAYPAPIPELVGAPEWVTRDRYDVTAIASGQLLPIEMRPMMQAMLADRFRLKAHYETRERPTYALRMARDDRRLGPELRMTKLDCAAITDANRRGEPVAPASNGAPPCGMTQSGGTLRSGGLDMPMLARMISGAAGRVVVDHTGLAGNYEFTLRYNTKPGAASSDPGEPPSIFTALQEQLGLKLEADRSALEIVVIDHIERPSPD